MDDLPSSYWFERNNNKLLVSCYVDDLVASGPEIAVDEFWRQLEKHFAIDPPQLLDTFKEGNTNTPETKIRQSVCSIQMTNFIENACPVYEELSGTKLKAANTFSA